MPRIRNYVCLLLAAGLLTWSASPGFAQTKLRWQFKQGQVFNQMFQQDMESKSNFGNQSIKQTFDVVWKVGAVDAEGSAEVVQEFTRVRMSIQAPGVTFSFDSDSKEEPTGIGAVLAPPLKAIAKARFTMKMSPLGEIRDVEVSDETVKALQSLPGAAQFGGSFSKEGLVNLVQQSATQFPQEPVQKGASWTSKLEMPQAQIGKLEALSELTYAGPQDVDGKSLERVNVQLTTKISPQENSPAKVTIKEQKAEGAFYFDNAAGRLDHSEMVQSMTMAITVGANNIEQTLVQTTKVRLTPASN